MATHFDTSHEQQELDSIIQEAHAVMARMDAVRRRFDAIGAEVDKAVGAVQHAKETFEHDVHALHDAATRFDNNVRNHGGDADHAYNAWASAIDAAAAKMEELKGHFDHSCESVYAAVDKSRTVLEQITDKVKQADHDVHDGVNHVIQIFHDEAGHLSQQFQSVTHPAMSALDEFVGHIHDQSDALANEAHGHLDQLQHAVDAQIHEHLIDPINQHVGHATELLANLGRGDVDSAVAHLTSNARQHIDEQMKSVITNLADHVSQGIDHVSESIQHAGDHNSGLRQLLKPAFDELEKLLHPVEETIGNVKSVASAVGFSI